MADAGRKVDRKRSTISGWVMKWRRQYGTEFLRGGNRQRSTLTEEDQRRGRLSGAGVQRAGWEEVRALAATELASVAFTGAEVVRKGLEALLKDKDRLALLEPADMRHLTIVVEMLAKRADALLDIPDHKRGALERSRVPVGNQASQPPPGLLNRLEGSEVDEVAATQRDAIEAAEVFYLSLATSDGERVDPPIETTARQAE